MDIPSPFEGIIKEISVSEGDKVSEGDIIGLIEVSGQKNTAEQSTGKADNDIPEQTNEYKSSDSNNDLFTITSNAVSAESDLPSSEVSELIPPGKNNLLIKAPGSSSNYHATPSVRKLARELGVDLSAIKASGPKGRILKEDLYKTVSRIFKNLIFRYQIF